MDGQPLVGVEVRAQLERVDYHTTARLSGTSSVQLMNRPVEVETAKCLVTTGKTAVTCRLPLAAAGNYQVRAWAEDLEHQTVQTGFPITVSGDNTVAWPRFDQDRIELVADKQSYKPGDTARTADRPGRRGVLPGRGARARGAGQAVPGRGPHLRAP